MDHKPTNIQIRLTEPDTEKVKNVLCYYLTENNMIWKHTPVRNPDNVHHHIYLFGVYRTAETIRKHLSKKGYDKSQYMVGITAGRSKVKITPATAYQYAANPKSQPQLVHSLGFNAEELAQFKADADNYYKPIQAIEVIKEEHYVVRPDRVWERLHAKYDDYKNLSVLDIKKKLAAEWLNNGKAIMRKADAHRYAVSLYYLNRYHADIPADAFDDYEV